MKAWAKFPWDTPKSVLADQRFKRLVARYDALNRERDKLLEELNAAFAPPPEREWAVGENGDLTTRWRREPSDDDDIFPI